MARYSIDFPEKVLDILEKISKDEGTTKAEVIRRALGLYNYVYTEMSQNGAKGIGILDANGNIEKEIVLT